MTPGRRRGRLLVVLAVPLLAVAGLVAADRLFPPDLGRLDRLSPVVTAENGAPLRMFTASDDRWRLPSDPDEVDPRYLSFLLAYEDGRFPYHLGVDPLALVRAVGQWFVNGRIVSGGSTLTMQVARLLEPRPRTVGSKLVEIARAFQLEWRFGKREIVGMYLTLAPFGGNLEGVRAGSRAWLRKEPTELTDAEAALLVALPQSPTRLRPDRDAAAARAGAAKVLRRMNAVGLIDARRLGEALDVLAAEGRAAFPFEVPHLARRLVERADAVVVRSTIDRGVQAVVEAAVQSTVRSFEAPLNVGVMVVEHETGAVRAHLGSRDFFEGDRQGQIDFTQALRSPGSTLKPFIYALAMGEGLIGADSVIDDRRRHFGIYAPANFSGDYQGAVTIREALQRSLNVPTVAVLSRYGPQRFVSRLAGVGVTMAHGGGSPDGPGLAVALGGVGITLEDLVMLYAGLARGGEILPLRLHADGPAFPPVRLVERQVAVRIADILRGVPRPAGTSAEAAPRVAYKTGTSYGYRDAWAVGFDGRFTVGVWVGRPDGLPMSNRTGLSTAAPLLLRIFELLPDGGPAGGFPGAVPSAFGPAVSSRAAAPQASVRTPPLSIRFPVDGTVIEAETLPGGAIPVTFAGGRRPFTLMVNGTPIAAAVTRRQESWSPGSRGYFTLSVVDAAGAIARAHVELR